MRLTSSVFVALTLVACRGGGNNPPGGDDDPGIDAPPGGSVTIQEVQNDAMPVGTVVELDGVVVTAIDSFGARTGDIWVQEPGGGEFSGIKVFGVPLDVVATLAVGDIVNIANAEKDEFALTADTSGRTVTEIKGAAGGMMSVVRVGPGTVPTPVNVDAKAIEMLATDAERDAEWEKWEGVLINVINVRQLGEFRAFSGGAEDQFEFDATGDLAVQSVLANIGTPAERVPGTCYAGIVGVGDYFFNYLLLPRAGSEVTDGGTGCSAVQSATIADIQAGTAAGSVSINDVFIAAISRNGKNLWVSHSLNAAANEGIFVFRGNGNGTPALGAEFVVGAKVNVSGTAVEQNNDANGDTVTQIAGGAAVTFVAAPTAAPTPVTNQTAAALTVAATGEPFESVLVTLTNVKVTAVGNQFGVGQLQQGATSFLFDDDAFVLPNEELNKCYASITGLWTYQVFDNAYGFLPLAVGAGTGTCP